jgi:medium-chain acyl-[acyl-carrier-protein] hydrolase
LAVQLPGRESRLSEPAFRRMEPLVDALMSGIRDTLAHPFALFGHSMGALVAFELSRALRRHGLPLPQTIVVSGRRAPTIPNTEPPLHGLSDPEFIRALVRRYDAIPRVISNEPDVMALFIPILKADFATFETHVYRHEPPLECALAMYGGRSDPQTGQMEGWAELCAGVRTTRLFDGGHFFIAEQRQAVAAALAQDVLATVAVS